MKQIQFLLLIFLCNNIYASSNDAGLLKQSLPVVAGLFTAVGLMAILTKSPKLLSKEEILQAYDQDPKVQKLNELSQQLHRLELRTIARNQRDYLDQTLRRNREEEGPAILEYNDQLCIREVINQQTGKENPSFDDIHVYQKAIQAEQKRRLNEISKSIYEKNRLYNIGVPHNGFITYCAASIGLCVGTLVHVAMQK